MDREDGPATHRAPLASVQGVFSLYSPVFRLFGLFFSVSRRDASLPDLRVRGSEGPAPGPLPPALVRGGSGRGTRGPTA